jgi:hypothetical protein
MGARFQTSYAFFGLSVTNPLYALTNEWKIDNLAFSPRICNEFGQYFTDPFAPQLSTQVCGFTDREARVATDR